MNKALIIFTRIPVPNKTKTRLLSLLSPQECADLHYAFLRDISSILESDQYDIYIFHGDEGDSTLLDPIFPNIPKYLQQGNNLGRRMLHAISTIFDKGYQYIALMGTDVPLISSQDIRDAFDSLILNDLIVGCTHDGGYYLIAMKKLYPEFFHTEIAWGTELVLEQTLASITKQELKTVYINSQTDIDTEEDLRYIMDHLNPMSYTAQYLHLIREKIC